jgi:hypothetical protein
LTFFLGFFSSSDESSSSSNSSSSLSSSSSSSKTASDSSSESSSSSMFYSKAFKLYLPFERTKLSLLDFLSYFLSFFYDLYLLSSSAFGEGFVGSGFGGADLLDDRRDDRRGVITYSAV